MELGRDDTSFAGSIPKLYDELLVPILFDPYAIDLVGRVAPYAPDRILEIAAGTGAVTRRLADEFPDASITGTDLNQAMVDHAASLDDGSRIHWRQADAMDLPFEDETFDAAVCQFGAMFFPDRVVAYGEVRRILEPDGVFFFNVWDAIEHSEFERVVTEALVHAYPDTPPRFFERTPHGYHDIDVVRRDLSSAGFTDVDVDTVALRSVAPSADDAALALCCGTPLRNELVAIERATLEDATRIAATALAERFGSGPIEGKMRAHVVVARKP